MTWILTHSGQRFDLANPDPASVLAQDIAASLSRLCRFNGHCSRFYSVAQHSLYVASIVPPQLQLVALLHDATEAYVGDMVRPLKRMIPEYQRIERAVWRAICTRFGIPEHMPAAVIYADLILLATERRDLLPKHADNWPCLEGIKPLPEPIPTMSAEAAQQEYLCMLLNLLNTRHRTRMPGGEA